MEEPPEHVKFILCTTEPHKVPPTIQSRCQRFDFRNIPSTQIESHLESVVKTESLTADPELISAVARLGNGSMRDALSLLDRLIAAGETHLTLELLESLLGLPDREIVGRLISAAADGDAKASLEHGAELLSRTSADQVCEALLDRFRDLMVLAACGPETTLVELSGDARRQEAELAGRFDAAGVVHMIALTESVQRALKSSSAPRALFDALLVRLAMTEKLADVTALVSGGGAASSATSKKA